MPSHAPRQSDRLLAVLLGLSMMVQPLSTDMYLPSLPGLARAFAVSTATAQWTLSGYVLAFGIMQLVLGPLSDRMGRRPVLIGGIALYIVASLLAALAPTIGVLIGARVLQAVGSCGAVVAARAIVRDAYTPTEGAQALARAATIMGLGPLLGPVLGGFLEVRFGFRGVFGCVVLLATAVLFANWRWMSETHHHRNPNALDPGRLVATYATVLRSPHFHAYLIVGTASFCMLFSFISGSPFVFINVLGVPTAWYGLCFASCAAGYLSGTVSCRHLLPRYGMTGSLRGASAVALASGLVMLALTLARIHHWAAILVPMIVCFTAHGIIFPCAQAGTTAPFARLAGAAAGLFGFLMMAAAAVLGVLIGATHNGTVYPMVIAIAASSAITFAGVHAGVTQLPELPPEAGDEVAAVA